jgi:hypothetical protein
MLVNGAGFYMYYAIQLQQIRTEMREALKVAPIDSLQVLILTTEQYKTSKVDEHEVRVNGKMYDIARIKLIQNKVHVYCIHDKDEDNLIVFLSEIISKPLKDKNNIPQPILKFLALSYLLPENVDVLLYVTEPVLNYATYRFTEITFQNRIKSPPPRVVKMFHFAQYISSIVG